MFHSRELHLPHVESTPLVLSTDDRIKLSTLRQDGVPDGAIIGVGDPYVSVVLDRIGRSILISLVDLDLLRQGSYRVTEETKGSGIYYANLRRPVGGRSTKTYLHRQIADRITGPSDLLVDHANRQSLDNRRTNLRRATAVDSARNRKVKPNASGYRGVTKASRSNNFIARIAIGPNQRLSKGGFKTAIEAARHYDKLARQHHGVFAVTNFPRCAR